MSINEIIAAQEPQAFSVSELNQQIKSLLESGIGSIWLKGEISNFKPHSSGHLYFSLKDPASQIKAVMFRGKNGRLKFKPQDGLEVLVHGQVSVYQPRGEYQIYVEHMEPLGSGALQKAFEELKKKLFNEGLFDPSHKKPIPKRPRKIAVITSPTGAAIQDILNILKRRVPSIPVILIPALVQGDTASVDLCRALDQAFRIPELDVIILGRGGGSMEDLWGFNDETLARKIFSSPLPIISAVGHEIDFTISDFVADLRAPTPSAAAELVAEADLDLIKKIQQITDKIISLFLQKIRLLNEKILNISARITDPQKKIRDLIQKKDELTDRLDLAIQNYLKLQKQKLQNTSQRLLPIKYLTQPLFLKITNLTKQIHQTSLIIFQNKKNKFVQQVGLLESLSPLRVLQRGYSFQTDLKGHIINSINQIVIGDEIKTHLVDGFFYSKVTDLKKETPYSSNN